VIVSLEEKDRRITEDLQQARAFQQRILPILPAHPRVRFAAAYRPAEMVGGDVYDVFALGDGRFRLFVADATGHGVQAAMRTMILKAEYDRIKDEVDAPEAVLAALNRRIVALYPDLALHCTAACLDLRLDDDGVAARYASAAHPPLLQVGVETTTRYEPGPFVGVSADATFDGQAFRAARGDRLFLFTDGAAEQWNASGAEYGIDRLHAALARPGPLPETTATWLAEVETFVGEVPFADDATVLAIEIVP
jgi:serine phosphatase RsbU (regulator of sigma subunit)